MRVLIIGAGGHGMVVADILFRAFEKNSRVEPIGFLDDNVALQDKNILGLPVYGPVAKLSAIPHDALILGIGDNASRKRVFLQMRQAGETMLGALHPTAILAPSAQIGAGTVICANAVVGVNAVVGENVILNTTSTVDHENVIEDHAHLSAGVHLGGGPTRIGEGVLLGIGSTVMPGIRIGAWSVVGAAALVHRDAPGGVTIVGVPGRVLERTKRESV